jgi:hypothetical protein
MLTNMIDFVKIESRLFEHLFREGLWLVRQQAHKRVREGTGEDCFAKIRKLHLDSAKAPAVLNYERALT